MKICHTKVSLHENFQIYGIVYIMYGVVVHGPRVTKAVMKMFSHVDISAIQRKKFVTYTPYGGD